MLILRKIDLPREHEKYCVLHRIDPVNAGGRPVILFHGASAARDTFLFPTEGNSYVGGIAAYLHRQGLNVWLADWRAGWRIANTARNRSNSDTWHNQLDLDQSISDIEICFKKVLMESGRDDIALLGHCLGGAVLSMAIATGRIVPRETPVILSTMGLFYRGSNYSQLKVANQELERIVYSSKSKLRWIHPHPHPEIFVNSEWPDELDFLYNLFLKANSQNCFFDGEVHSNVSEICNRLIFMYGRPYLESALHQSLHYPLKLSEQFGAVHSGIYLHGARNLRRGWAAPFNAGNCEFDTTYIGISAKENFERSQKVLLMSGNQNELWHRDSIDRMYEWLIRGSPALRKQYHKKIFSGFGHQDLYWGKHSEQKVFPYIADFLKL